MSKDGFDLETLQGVLNSATDIIKGIKEQARENGYYMDENNQLKKIEKVWVIDIDYKYLDDYLGDSDWIIKHGKGTKEIKEDKVKEIIDAILYDEDEKYIDEDSISEVLGEVFGWHHYYLENIPVRFAKIEEGTLENGDLKITFGVRTEVEEGRFEKCILSIYSEEKQKVDINHWEETGCR